MLWSERNWIQIINLSLMEEDNEKETDRQSDKERDSTF